MSARDPSEPLLVALAGFAAVVAAAVGASVLWAFVIHQLWGWFAVPLGAPVLALPHLWGLMILKGLIFFKKPADDEKAQWGLFFTYPLIAWALGAIAAWWMA